MLPNILHLIWHNVISENSMDNLGGQLIITTAQLYCQRDQMPSSLSLAPDRMKCVSMNTVTKCQLPNKSFFKYNKQSLNTPICISGYQLHTCLCWMKCGHVFVSLGYTNSVQLFQKSIKWLPYHLLWQNKAMNTVGSANVQSLSKIHTLLPKRGYKSQLSFQRCLLQCI